MPRASAFLSPEQLVVELTDGLEKLDELGVEWRNTRFGNYLRVYPQAMASAGGPLLDGDPTMQSPYFEAASQCRQLLDALPLLERHADEKRHQFVRLVLSGGAMPARQSDADMPRNLLFELAAGALLARIGFDVRLPDTGDLRIVGSGMPSIAVECKRPARESNIHKSLKDARRQLRGRDPNDDGMAMLSVDRATDLGTGGVSQVEREADIEASLEGRFESVRRKIMRSAHPSDPPLFPEVTLVGLAIIGPTIYIREERRSVSVMKLTFISLAPPDHPLSRTLASQFERYVASVETRAD